MKYRNVPGTDLHISPVSLGCWPMAGISSLEVNEPDSLATIEAALDAGVNHFDTAFSYGYDGESDRILEKALRGKTGFCISSKVGSHYTSDRRRVLEGTPSRLKMEADIIRKRLQLDCIPILYLHSPDGSTPIEASAEALAQLQHDGIIRYAALSNATPEETLRFASVIQPVLLQPPFNMLQQETVEELRPVANEKNMGIACYWPLMKGLLAGKMERNHRFQPEDRRTTYAIYQGDAWQRSQDFLDRLKAIARGLGWTVVRLVVRWTMDQPNITTVLCGAKRPDQILESAEAMQDPIPSDALAAIESALVDYRTAFGGSKI